MPTLLVGRNHSHLLLASMVEHVQAGGQNVYACIVPLYYAIMMIARISPFPCTVPRETILNSNKELLLGYSYGTYQFPGGHVEEGETFSEKLYKKKQKRNN